MARSVAVSVGLTLAAGVVGFQLLSNQPVAESGSTEPHGASGTPVEHPPTGAAIASPFSATSDADMEAVDDDMRNGKSTVGGARAAMGQAAPDAPPVDTSQELHIQESRRNHGGFLAQPDGYRKYKHLIGVQYEHVPELGKHVYDQFLSYHGRRAFDEIVQHVKSNPDDHEANAERYRQMLEIIATMPCEPDDTWNGCIVQVLGTTRDEVERAEADAASLVAWENLAKLRGYGPDVDLGTPEGQAYRALYDSLAPVLAGAIEGDEIVIRRFGLTVDEAKAIVERINRHDGQATGGSPAQR